MGRSFTLFVTCFFIMFSGITATEAAISPTDLHPPPPDLELNIKKNDADPGRSILLPKTRGNLCVGVGAAKVKHFGFSKPVKLDLVWKKIHLKIYRLGLPPMSSVSIYEPDESKAKKISPCIPLIFTEGEREVPMMSIRIVQDVYTADDGIVLPEDVVFLYFLGTPKTD